MTPKDRYKNQRNFIEARKAEGLERLVLWVKPEDKPDLKLIARQSHAIAKLRAEIEAEIRRELGPAGPTLQIRTFFFTLRVFCKELPRCRIDNKR